MKEPDGPAYTYHGQTYRLMQWTRGDTGEPSYGLKCPKCGRIGTLSGHDYVRVDEQGRPTVHPSMICPQNCGLHVWLRDGVMTDC